MAVADNFARMLVINIGSVTAIATAIAFGSLGWVP